MTITQPETVEGTFYLDAPCPAWCRGQHHPGESPEDRRHLGGDHEVALSTEHAVRMDAAGAEWAPDHLSVELQQHVRETEPRVLLYRLHEDAPDHPHLTLAEAEQLAAVLLALVRQARGQDSRPVIALPAPTDAERRRVSAGVDVEGKQTRLERAAELLAALEGAGRALGVDPEDWRAVTSLPAACWDVTRLHRRGSFQPGQRR